MLAEYYVLHTFLVGAFTKEVRAQLDSFPGFRHNRNWRTGHELYW